MVQTNNKNITFCIFFLDEYLLYSNRILINQLVLITIYVSSRTADNTVRG